MRVVIAEDGVLMREGLLRMLTEGGHTVAAAVGDAVGLTDLCRDLRPDLVLVDVRMPPTFTTEGLAAAVELRGHLPETGVLVLSQYVERRHTGRLLETGGAGRGGVGYLLKDRVLAVGDFLAAVERVAAGDTVLDPEAVRGLVDRNADPLSRLSPREREVLGLMAEGYTNPAIAARLYISRSAVEKCANAVFGKLGLAGDADGYSRRVLAILRFLGER